MHSSKSACRKRSLRLASILDGLRAKRNCHCRGPRVRGPSAVCLGGRPVYVRRFQTPLYLAFSGFLVTTHESRNYAPSDSGSACITPRCHVLVRSCNPNAPLGYFSDCPPWLPIISMWS